MCDTTVGRCIQNTTFEALEVQSWLPCLGCRIISPSFPASMHAIPEVSQLLTKLRSD